MTTISAAASGLHQHHSVHPSDVDMLEAITTMPTLRQNGFHQHASSSSSASSSPSVHFDMPARKRNLDTLHALRRPPIDPIVLAASLSSGPHVTRHHFHHSFGPKVESKQMSRSQRVKLQEEEQKAEVEKAKRSAQGRHRAGSYANCDRDEVHDALRKAPSATQDVTPKVDGEVNAYFSKQAPRSERLRREQEAKEAVEKAKTLKQRAQPPDLTRLPSYQLNKELQERKVKIKTGSGTPSSLGAVPHSGQQSAVIEAPSTPAISSIVRPPPIHVRCYARTRIPTPHGEVFCHLYRNNRDNKEHLALVVDTAQNALGGRWEDAEEVHSTMSTSIRSKTLDEVWGPHETEMERIVRGAYVGRLGPNYQVASKAGRTGVDQSKSHDIPSAEAPLVRIHSECYTGETIGSQRCDCGEQLDEAIRLIHADSRPARGVVVYLRQEGRGIGLLDKLMAYNLQDMGHDTVSANILLGHLADARKYDVAAEILRDLGLSSCRLLTNNPEKMEALESEGISVEKRVPMVPRVWRHGLLERKRSKAKRRTRALEESIVSQMDLHPGSDIEDFSDDASDASRESYVDHVLRRAGATMLGGSMTRGPELEKYLRTKVERMGHLLDLPAEQTSPNPQQSTEDYSDEDETALLTDEEHAHTADDDVEEILIRESASLYLFVNAPTHGVELCIRAHDMTTGSPADLPSHQTVSPPLRVASGSNHPLRQGPVATMGEEGGQEGPTDAQKRATTASSRPYTFAGTGSTDDYFSRAITGTDSLEPGASSSWVHPKTAKAYDIGRDQSPTRAGSIPPRLSTLRAVSTSGLPSVGTGYEGHPAGLPDIEAEVGAQTWRANAIGSTPLERTIDAIGMGKYQYAVLILSGFGWAADNMWLQGIAIILPRVQDEWGISNRWIGLVSSCTFAGMMVGALAWGSYSDTFGRKNAFNATLLITSIFGMLSAFSPNFPLLCCCLFLLGTGVGGSMPTDGTIFLEALPKRSHYLLTALSVFFAAGSVISSILGLILIPSNSCGGATVCNVADNKGWRWLLISLGVTTALFVMARLVFFRLFESPKFLVSAGRHEEARSVLQRIADFNGDPKKVRLSDVNDQEAAERTRMGHRKTSGLRASLSRWKPTSWVGQRDASLDWQDGSEERQRLIAEGDSRESTSGERPSLAPHTLSSSRPTARSGWLPASWKASLDEGRKRYVELFSPRWFKTTVLVWSIWTVFTLAYTMVNIFLPKYLQERSHKTQTLRDDADAATRQHSMEAVMQEFLLYSLASLPGSILGAFLVETPLGRIKSMAISTAFLALALLSFAFATSPAAVVASSCSISLFASVAYAVIYSYPPEVFETSVRGTAGGTASALSRFAGMLAPLLAGLLMSINTNMPLFLGFFLFAFTVWLELSLPFETRQDPNTSREPASSPTS